MRQIAGALLVALYVSRPASAEITDHAEYKSAFDQAEREMKATVKGAGVSGMKSGIDDCYRKFAKGRSEITLIYCYALHRVAGDLDGAFSAVTNLDVQDAALTRGAATMRALRGLKRLGYTEERGYQKLGAWELYGYERR